MEYLNIILFISIFLFLLFETDFIIQYFKLFKITEYIPYYNEYNNIILNDGYIHYFSYLHNRSDNFFIKLITCPICIGFWIAILVSISSFGLFYFPIFYFGGLSSYWILKILAKYSN